MNYIRGCGGTWHVSLLGMMKQINGSLFGSECMKKLLSYGITNFDELTGKVDSCMTLRPASNYIYYNEPFDFLFWISRTYEKNLPAKASFFLPPK